MCEALGLTTSNAKQKRKELISWFGTMEWRKFQ
jgi:hypothetical protein